MIAREKVLDLKSRYGDVIINDNDTLLKCYIGEELNLSLDQINKLKNLQFSFEGLTRARRLMTERKEIEHPAVVIQHRAEQEQRFKYGLAY